MPEDVNKGRKRNPLEAKGAALGMASAAATLGVTFGVSSVMHGVTGGNRSRGPSQTSAPLLGAAQPVAAGTGGVSAQLVRGRVLYVQECVSCHGVRAQGGIGPALRRSEMSESQIAATIKAGMKPEMPAFGRKYGDADVRALTVYVRSLKR